MPPPPRGNPLTKLLTAGALFAFAACTFSLPAILATNASASLYASDDPISSAATRRGAFMNAGSKDVGSTTIAGGEIHDASTDTFSRTTVNAGNKGKRTR